MPSCDIVDEGEDESRGKDETVIRLSNKEYRTRNGNKYRARRSNVWRRAAQVADIETATPSKSVSTLAEYLLFITYTYAHLSTLLAFYGSKKWRRQRFDAYIGKHKAQETLCNEFVEKCGDPSALIAVFGAAKFNHASAGHAPAPRGGWMRKGLMRRGVYVAPDLDEFRTSQKCSLCHEQLEQTRIHWQGW